MPTRRAAAAVLAVLGVLAALVGPAPGAGAGAPPTWPTADEAVAGLGPGINIGNALEAPVEGAWGVTIDDALLDAIAEAGFEAVRLPVKVSAHAEVAPPYTIDPAFLARIDEVLDGLEARGLAAVVDLHHYDEIHDDPAGHRDRFVALWTQLAAHLADRPPTVWFELLNEPTLAFPAATWNAIAADALAAVRATNPERIVLVGSVAWSVPATLDQLVLPDDDHLAATVHYYLPLPFTHQGAGWVPGSDAWVGTRWTGTPEEREAVAADLRVAARWSRDTGVPVVLGELGAIVDAPSPDRAAYLEAVARTAEACDIPWFAWQITSNFGIWDQADGTWDEAARDALLVDDGDPAPVCLASDVAPVHHDHGTRWGRRPGGGAGVVHPGAPGGGRPDLHRVAAPRGLTRRRSSTGRRSPGGGRRRRAVVEAEQPGRVVVQHRPAQGLVALGGDEHPGEGQGLVVEGPVRAVEDPVGRHGLQHVAHRGQAEAGQLEAGVRVPLGEGDGLPVLERTRVAEDERGAGGARRWPPRSEPPGTAAGRPWARCPPDRSGTAPGGRTPRSRPHRCTVLGWSGAMNCPLGCSLTPRAPALR